VGDVAEDVEAALFGPLAEVRQGARGEEGTARRDELVDRVRERLAAAGPHDQGLRDEEAGEGVETLDAVRAGDERGEEPVDEVLEGGLVHVHNLTGWVLGGGADHGRPRDEHAFKCRTR